MRWTHGAPPTISDAIALPRAGRDRPFEDRVNLVAAAVEQAIVIPRVGIFLIGWLFDPRHRMARLRLRAGDLTRDLELDTLIRAPRADVASPYRGWSPSDSDAPVGLAGLVALPSVGDDSIAATLELELVDATGQPWPLDRRGLVRPSGDPLPVIREILAASDWPIPGDFDRHVGPAVSALWMPPGRDMGVVDIGHPPERPRVSIVVPVHGRYDLIEYQLALFADDPDLHDVEVIYVVDEPRIADQAERLCRAIQPIFGTAFRLVLNHGRRWLADASNVGAELARGPLLLLLGARAMPVGRGWLAATLEAHSRLPDRGLLGPRLLRLDGSVHSEGIGFSEDPTRPGIWGRNPADVPPGTSHDRPREVPALSSACLMISRGLYADIGGMDARYLASGFEDSDLCLKARQAGHGSHVVPWVRMFYLDGMPDSLPGDEDWDRPFSAYGAWRHTRRWARVLDDTKDASSDG